MILLYNIQPEALTEANRVYQRRSLHVFRDPGSGIMTLTVELPIEEGEVISQALAREADADGAPVPAYAKRENSRKKGSANSRSQLRGRHLFLNHRGNSCSETDRTSCNLR